MVIPSALPSFVRGDPDIVQLSTPCDLSSSVLPAECFVYFYHVTDCLYSV